MTFHIGTGSLNRTCCELHPPSWRWVKILRTECLQPFAPILCDWGNQREVVWAERSQMRAFTSPTCPSTLCLPSRFLLPVFFFFFFPLDNVWPQQRPPLTLAAPNHLPPTHGPLVCPLHFLSACLPKDRALGGCVDARTIAAARRRYHMHMHKPPHARTHTILTKCIVSPANWNEQHG